MPTNLTGSTIASTYDQLLHIDGGPTAVPATVYSGTGVATAFQLGTLSGRIANVEFTGTTVQAVSPGFLTLGANIAFANAGNARVALGLGTMATQAANNVSITGGAISGVTFTGSFSGITSIDSTTFTTSNTTTGLTLTDNTLSADGTDTNIDINITPKGTGEVNLPKVDIDAGAIDGTAIGANAVSTIRGTTILATQQLGYTTGAGGTVTQLTSRTTGVTLNQITGEIVLFAGTIAGHEADEFTLTNSEIGANDVVVVSIKSGCAAGTRKYYQTQVVEVAAGSCVISVGNLDNGTIPSTGTDSPVLQFAVIKSVVA